MQQALENRGLLLHHIRDITLDKMVIPKRSSISEFVGVGGCGLGVCPRGGKELRGAGFWCKDLIGQLQILKKVECSRSLQEKAVFPQFSRSQEKDNVRFRPSLEESCQTESSVRERDGHSVHQKSRRGGHAF